MPTTDVRAHTVPAATDSPSRSAFLSLSLSTRDPIPVANTTARATKITDLASAGITPSTSNPVFFFRADAGAGRELEYTTDGSTFLTVPTAGAVPFATAVGVQTIVTTAASLTTAAITFPAGRFTQTPLMPAPNVASAAGGTATMTARAIATSTTAATLYLYSATGTTFTAGLSVPLQWTAIQMTSAAAAG